MKMIPQGLSSTLKAPEDTTKIQQIKKQFPAEYSFLQGKPYRPIRLQLELLQHINSELRKGKRNG